MTIKEKQLLIDFYISSPIFTLETKWMLIFNLLNISP